MGDGKQKSSMGGVSAGYFGWICGFVFGGESGGMARKTGAAWLWEKRVLLCCSFYLQQALQLGDLGSNAVGTALLSQVVS